MATYAPPSPPFIGAKYHGGPQVPTGIVIHGTVSPDNAGSARAIAKWWNGLTSPKTSAHYVVDPKEIIQCVGDHVIAYHCGYNTGTIAIELCDEETGPASRWKDADSQKILDNAAHLTAQLCLAYGIEVRRPSTTELKQSGPHGIYGHNDSRLAFGNTTHTDPKDFDWPDFLARVRREVAKLKATVAVPAKAKPAKVQSRIQKFNAGGPAYDMRLLDDAIKNGRTGLVKSVRDAIDREVKKLPNDKKNTLIKQFVTSYTRERHLRMGLLYNAIHTGGRGGAKSVQAEINAQLNRLKGIR